MAAGRDFSDPVALNWFTDGTDVDWRPHPATAQLRRAGG